MDSGSGTVGTVLPVFENKRLYKKRIERLNK
jgi:hypothetical protein